MSIRRHLWENGVRPLLVSNDGWWMLGLTLVLFPIMFTAKLISRIEGFALLSLYVVYLSLLLLV